jgi:hypothetical protein
MEVQEFVNKIKAKLGGNFPDDLVFEYKDGRLFFYNKDTPDKSTILEFSQVVDFKLNLDHCVEIIKHYHSPKMWMETFNPNDPKHDLSKGIYNAMVESANKKKHVGKEPTKQEVHENRSSKYEFLEFGKGETIEEAIEKIYGVGYSGLSSEERVMRACRIEGFFDGSKWQSEKMYSKEDLKEAFNNGFYTAYGCKPDWLERVSEFFNKWFEKHKKSPKLLEKKITDR